MAQTPVSVSVNIAGGSASTPSNIYTVPTGKTAIVRAISALSPSGGGSQMYVSKSISGQSYPIVYAQNSTYFAATGSTGQNQTNLLPEPLTMAAGEILQVSTDSNGLYNIPSVSTAPTTAVDGTTVFITQIIYGNSQYMAIGYSGTGAYVATSTDCVTWTQRTSASSLASRFTYVAYSNSIWVAIYQSTASAIYYSTDNGVTWATATGISGITPYMVYGANNQLVVTSSTGRIYYSTNGSTWTQYSDFYTNAGGQPVRSGGWTGSHWLFCTQFGCLATTNLSTTLYYGGINNGQNLSVYSSIDYSPAYSKYYATRRTASVNNIFSSSEGLLWTGIWNYGGFSPYKIACAGSNTVLIGVSDGLTTGRALSTDGVNFSVSSDVRSYQGPVFGLANGYFLSYLNITDDRCYVSTNPTSSTGTAGGPGNQFAIAAAAADPVTGKWCSIGKDTSTTTWVIQGGSSATNINASVTTGITIDSTNGNPVSMCWSAADGYFYILSDTGQVWRTTDWNGSLNQVSSGIGFSAYNSGSACNIRAVGTSLYVAYGGNGAYIYLGSTLNGGTSWSNVQITAINQGYYQPTNTVRSAGIYQEGAGATNGSYYFTMNQYGACVGFNPAGVRSNPITPPMAGGSVQTLNGYTFMYGALNRSTNTVGIYWSSNVITTYGSYYGFSNNLIGNQLKPAMFMTYVSGTYYVTNIDVSSYVFNSTNLSTWSFKAVGTSMAGVPVVNISGGFSVDGTNMVSWTTSGQPNNITKTSSPQNYVYAATVTASVVEIS